MQDIWEPVELSLYFPLSDCRSESHLPDLVARRTSSSALKHTSRASPAVSLFTSSYSTNLPNRWQTSPGVWTDGKSTVFSSALPEVQKLLADARKTLVLPRPSSDLILTLAALEVFYRPGDPAHWMFWSDDKKSSTADVVTRIALHNPPLILSPVAWNGKQEYLSILANHHGSSWKQLYETKEWYTILVPPKPTTPPRSFQLRARRVAPGAMREPSRSPGLEDDIHDVVSLRGTQNTRTNTSARTVTEQPQAKSRPARGSNKPLARSTSVDLSDSPPDLPLSSTVQDPEEGLTPLSEISDLPSEPAAKPARRKRKVVSPSRYPEPLSNNSKSSPETSLLLGPEPTETAKSATTHTHNRTRSTSTDSSSAVTVVDSAESRSGSVSSAVTIVSAANTSPHKRKADTIEDEEPEPEAAAEIEEEEEEGPTKLTRSRKRAKAQPASKPPPKRRTTRKA